MNLLHIGEYISWGTLWHVAAGACYHLIILQQGGSLYPLCTIVYSMHYTIYYIVNSMSDEVVAFTLYNTLSSIVNKKCHSKKGLERRVRRKEDTIWNGGYSEKRK